ncbi:MAG: hypothetical protein QOH46_2053 [Solirubrobacteraceae bacterium]|jgi:uncharacterized protein (TIGR02271 family)|nr:hypothetical protein [Solirubrobacteraceae bacterium]
MTTQNVTEWRGQELLDNSGEKIGTIEEIYLDTDTDQPEWALVKTGLFGGKGTFVPLAQANPGADGVQVPFEKAHVKDAPNIDPDGQLSQSEERTLYEHYGLGYADNGSGSGNGNGAGGSDEPVGRDTSGPTTDDAMTRSEEELSVGTTERETGRARLRKYVVTEDVETTVPVRREEVRVEREPITEGNVGDATDGPAISEEEHEVTLHAEEAVVDKQVVPKERVRLDKDVVEDERQVSETVSKEQIEVDGAEERR